jgi:UDPglucose 6-dehydrogenase
MKIAVIGTGYVGLVTGTCLSDLGNEVVCCDIDESKLARLRKGESPIYEPGLDELLKSNLERKRLSFTSDTGEAVKNSEVIFIAVGTPPDKKGHADLTAVQAVAKIIGENMNSYKIVINKSTVPVGSGDMVRDLIVKNMISKQDFDVVSNPEFLKEGSAIEDFMEPDRVVIGADSPRAADKIREIYAPLEAEILVTDIKSAEIIKYASNAFLATKISFINEIANFCELVDASVELVAKGMGLDSRIGPQFLKAGIGYGGSCFPKDTLALYEKGKELGYEFKVVKAAMDANEEKKRRFLKRSIDILRKHGCSRVAVWGLAFKPNTDDMRDAPSIVILQGLVKEGFKVTAYDPVAEAEAKKIIGDKIAYAKEYEALNDADALMILTEWNEFKQADFEQIRKRLKKPVIIDGRNIYHPAEMKKQGFKYYSIGHADIE